jgi:hypothetical protein
VGELVGLHGTTAISDGWFSFRRFPGVYGVFRAILLGYRAHLNHDQLLIGSPRNPARRDTAKCPNG